MAEHRALETTDGAGRPAPVPLGPVLFAVLAASLIRVPATLSEDFPLGDGGLFLAIVEAIRDGGALLPDRVAFNGESIPFTYPPLGFWLGAAFAALPGSDALEALRWLPLAFSLATAALVPLLARDLLGEGAARPWVAAAVFAVLPRAWTWPLMGGGLTRSPGFFFALAALLLAGRAARGQRGGVPMAAAALGGAALSHPEWAVTAAVAVSLRLATSGLGWKRAGGVLVRTFGLAALPIAAWALPVALRTGLAPFLAAVGTAGYVPASLLNPILELRVLQSEHAAVSPALLAAVGAFSLLRRGTWFVPLWLAAIWVSTPRHASTPSSAALALLVAEGCAATATALVASRPGFARLGLSAPAAASVVAGAWLAATAAGGRGAAPPEVAAVPRPVRDVFARIRSSTPPEATFLVLTDGRDWFVDAKAEWFPVLAGRRSLTTAQGLEWLPPPAFRDRVVLIRRIKALQSVAPGLLAERLHVPLPGPLYVAVLLPEAPRDWGGFLPSSRYELLLAAPGGLVFREKLP